MFTLHRPVRRTLFGRAVTSIFSQRSLHKMTNSSAVFMARIEKIENARRAYKAWRKTREGVSENKKVCVYPKEAGMGNGEGGEGRGRRGKKGTLHVRCPYPSTRGSQSNKRSSSFTEESPISPYRSYPPLTPLPPHTTTPFIGQVVTPPCKARQNEDTLWRQHCVLRCCPPVAKRGNIVARRADTRNVSEDFQKHVMCPGHKMCVGHKCCERGKMSQHLGNMITSAMLLPPRCVLVLPGPNVQSVECTEQLVQTYAVALPMGYLMWS